MFKCDYHMHTGYSADSDAAMESMIQKSIELSLDEICFTDHVDYVPWVDLSPEPARIDYDKYLTEFNSLREKYKSKISIRLGVEIGLAPDLAETVSGFVSKYPFDFIVGSTHDVQKRDLYLGYFFEGKDKETAFREYFEEILTNVKLIDDFCVYGHFDYIRRYGGYADNSLYYGDYSEIIDAVLRELILRGKGLEVNTSGFRYGLNQVHPQLEILKKYKELGGEVITIGSDAHSPERIYEKCDYAREIIKEAGFNKITVFRNRKPEWVKI